MSRQVYNILLIYHLGLGILRASYGRNTVQRDAQSSWRVKRVQGAASRLKRKTCVFGYIAGTVSLLSIVGRNNKSFHISLTWFVHIKGLIIRGRPNIIERQLRHTGRQRMSFETWRPLGLRNKIAHSTSFYYGWVGFEILAYSTKPRLNYWANY